MSTMAIKDLIRAGRERLKMTEQRFANAARVSRAAVQQWESGATAPSRKHQQAVADLIGVTVGELAAGQSEKYPETMPGRKTGEPLSAYNVNRTDEARRLFESLSEDGQREAINYLRFLAQQYPVEQSNGSNDHPVPNPKKAA